MNHEDFLGQLCELEKTLDYDLQSDSDAKQLYQEPHWQLDDCTDIDVFLREMVNTGPLY